MKVNRRTLLAGAPLALLATMNASNAQGAPPPRTTLPTDSAISVYIGVRATWQSLKTGAVRFMELSADVACYTLSDTATVDNIYDHSIASMPLLLEDGWAAFRPTTDTLRLRFKIADTRNRLGKIIVTDLQTGRVLGNVVANANGSLLQGDIEVDYGTPYYRIEGADQAGSALFRLAASNGRPDTYVHFKVGAMFQPYRPATIPSVRYAGHTDLPGKVGDPYNWHGVEIQSAGLLLSKGCGAVDKVNDLPVSNSVLAPGILGDLVKKAVIQAPDASVIAGFVSNEKEDLPKLADAIAAAATADMAKALSQYSMLPYSDNTAHWHATLSGNVLAFFVVPYRVKREGWLPFVAGLATSALATIKGDDLTRAIISGIQAAAQSETDARKRFVAGQVVPVGDVKTVPASEEIKEPIVLNPLLQEVSFQIVPDIAPPSVGYRQGKVTLVSAWTTPSPPGPANGGDLTFASATGIAKMMLAKGYKWKASGNILSPMGYQGGTTDEFQTPLSSMINIPCTLMALLTLNIYTASNANPAGPVSLPVQVLNAAGQVVASGNSTLQNGKAVFTMITVTPGTYTIKVQRGTSGGSWSGTATITVQRGVLQEVTVTATYTPPPHP